MFFFRRKHGKLPKKIVFHTPQTEPVLDFTRGEQVWWVGRGVYCRQTDGLWLRQCTSRYASDWTAQDYWPEPPKNLVVIDAEAQLLAALRRFNLPTGQKAFVIPPEALRVLIPLADRFQIPWSWSQHNRHGFFTFSWRYPR